MEPITVLEDLILHKQNMKVKSVNPLHSDCKDRNSDWLADNNNLTSRASSSPTF